MLFRSLSGGYKTYQMSSQKQSNEDIFARDVIYKDDNIYQAHPDGAKVGRNGHKLQSDDE